MSKLPHLRSRGVPSQKSRLRQNVESIGLALLLALVIRSSVVEAFWVPSGSMLPTIQIGDHLFVNKLAYHVHLPLIGTQLAVTGHVKSGDIVVFVSPTDGSTDLIKRVIAVEGDSVEIREKKLFVNGQEVSDVHANFLDPHLRGNPRDTYGPVVVPPGKFFVMGDNRDQSYDSRYWGFADVNTIKGQAGLIYWSWDKEARWPRFERLGHMLD